MPSISTQIEITAAPSEVRKAFLDFDSYPTWAKAHLKKIEVVSGDKENLKAGDKIKVFLTGATFPGVIVINTPEELRWRGSLPGIFTGEHFFRFQPSEASPTHTTLVQGEDFSGLFSFLMGQTWSAGQKTKHGFEGFNEELKARVEGS